MHLPANFFLNLWFFKNTFLFTQRIGEKGKKYRKGDEKLRKKVQQSTENDDNDDAEDDNNYDNNDDNNYNNDLYIILI